jgi:hypothetical protein
LKYYTAGLILNIEPVGLYLKMNGEGHIEVSANQSRDWALDVRKTSASGPSKPALVNQISEALAGPFSIRQLLRPASPHLDHQHWDDEI